MAGPRFSAMSLVVGWLAVWPMNAAGATDGEFSAVHGVFHLCRSEVHAAEIVPDNGRFRVVVQLNAKPAQALAALTRESLGKHLHVMAGDKAVSVAVVQSPIDSGQVASGPLDEREAADLLERIGYRLPASPCGGVAPADRAFSR